MTNVVTALRPGQRPGVEGQRQAETCELGRLARWLVPGCCAGHAQPSLRGPAGVQHPPHVLLPWQLLL